MKTSAILSGLLAVSTITSAAPAASPDSQDFEKRQNGNIATTGVTGNGVRARIELRTMQQQHPTMFNLYLLGMQDFQAIAQSDPLSYYSIAGIHGRPHRSVNGATFGPNGGGNGAGYCTHVSNIFLPWHTPFLALFEQQLYKSVQKVAAKYSQNVQNVAKNFRIPYWDWAAPNCPTCKPFPALISQSWASICLDNKPCFSIKNPLWRYDFTNSATQRAQDFVFNPFAQWQVSKRYPTSFDANGLSDNTQVSPAIAANQAGLRTRVYALLTNYDNFTQFGNEAWLLPNDGSGNGKTDSLESVHDIIHGLTGGNGHMTYLDYSAFDPVFWLHHANVDRLYALWVSLHGGSSSSYVQPMNQVASNYFYTTGQNQDANSPLYPFRNANGQWYTANTVRSMSQFGYTYPELVSGQSVISQVNALYNSQSSSSKKAKKAKKAKRGLISALTSTAPDASSERHYTANIVSQKFSLQGSYSIYLFMGDVPTDPSTWSNPNSNLVGTHFVLANLNSDASRDLKVTGSIAMTAALEDLVDAGQISDMTPDEVGPYVRDNMSWRVLKADGSEVPVDQLADLSISVVTATYQAPKDMNSLPKWGAWESMPNCTSGQVGGHDDAYWSVPAHVSGHLSYGENVALGFNIK